MRKKDFLQSSIAKIAASLIVLGGISLSVNQFLLSLRVIKLTHQTAWGEMLFTNYRDFSTFFFSSGFLLFLVLYLLVTIQSLVLRRKTMWPWPDILWKQSVAYSPFLLLVFGVFFAGKAVHFIILIPLLPLYIALIFIIFIGLNLNLHIQPGRKIDISLFKPIYHGKTIIVLVVLALVLIHLLALKPYYQRFNSHRFFIGDEPKYLRMTNSLAEDKDLDLSNDFEDISQDLVEAEKNKILKTRSRRFGHLSIIGKNGGIYHLHMPGLSFILLPGYLLDKMVYSEVSQDSSLPYYFPEKLFFLGLWILGIGVLIFLLAARIIYKWLESIFLMSAFLIFFMFFSPVPEFIVQIYPEAAACLITLLVLNAIFYPFKPAWINWVIIVAGTGYLPWLHQRFIFLSLGLFLAIIIENSGSKKRIKTVMISGGFLGIASLPYFYYFYSITGSVLPNSLYTVYGESFTRFNVLPLGFFGHLFDLNQGIIWLYPWTLFALTGVYWCFKFHFKKAWMLVLIFMPYYLMTCLHVSWAGLNPKPGKYLVAVFPVLLIFSLYTVISFLKKPNLAHLSLYTVFILFLLLNRKYGFIQLEFTGSFISRNHIFHMGICILILFSLFFSLYIIDKKKWDDASRFSLFKIKRSMISTFKYLSLNHYFRYFSSLLLIIIPLILSYFLLFSGNFSLFKDSFFPRIRKTGRYKDLVLESIQDPGKKMVKGKKIFSDLFLKEFDFLLKESDSPADLIDLESTSFYQKIFKGGYKVEVVSDDMSWEGAALALNFLSQRKNLKLMARDRELSNSAAFLIFKDQYVSSDLIIRDLDPVAGSIAGTVKISPVPAFCYGEELIVRPVRPWNPVRRKNSNHGYSMAIMADSKVIGKNYDFLIFTIYEGRKFDPARDELLVKKRHYFQELETHLIDINLDLNRKNHKNLKGLALMVLDSDQRYLRCRSILYETGENYGNIPFSFQKRAEDRKKQEIEDIKAEFRR